MRAWAAEALAAEPGAVGAEPFYATAEFWVLIAFLIFVGAVFRTAYRVITIALDDRAERIKNQIEEATRLAEESQALLASYERKQRTAAEEADLIIDRARGEADRIAERAADDLQRSLKRREELAIERIQQAEAQAIADVRRQAIDVALAATHSVIAAEAKGKRANALIDAAIKDLPKKLKVH